MERLEGDSPRMDHEAGCARSRPATYTGAVGQCFFGLNGGIRARSHPCDLTQRQGGKFCFGDKVCLPFVQSWLGKALTGPLRNSTRTNGGERNSTSQFLLC